MSNSDQNVSPQTNQVKETKPEESTVSIASTLQVGMIVRVSNDYIGVISKVDNDSSDIAALNTETIDKFPEPVLISANDITTPYESDNSNHIIAIDENRYYFRDVGSLGNSFLIRTGYSTFIITEEDYKVFKLQKRILVEPAGNNEYYYVYPTQTGTGYIKATAPVRPTNQDWTEESEIRIARGMIIDVLPDPFLANSTVFLGVVCAMDAESIKVVWIDEDINVREMIIPDSEVGYYIRSPYEPDSNSSIIPIYENKTGYIIRVQDIASNSFTIFLNLGGEGILYLGRNNSYQWFRKTNSSISQ